MRRNRSYGILATALILSGCASLISQPTPTPEPVMADCFIYFHLTAWEDLNANGIQDDGEGPLEGVEFTVNGPYAYSISHGKGSTDADGYVSIDTWSPDDCPETDEFEINAIPPTGYALPADLPFRTKADSMSNDYAFGFLID